MGKRPARIGLLLFSILAMLLAFQNCGDVNILQVASLPEPGEVISTPSISFLKAPSNESSYFRAAFVVDMSFSMVADACSGTLDMVGLLPSDRPVADCSDARGTGVDNIRKRLNLIAKWIQDSEQVLSQRQDYSPTETLKILIVPFAGPPAENELKLSSGKFPEAQRFVDAKTALKFVSKLKILQCGNNCLSASDEVPDDLADWLDYVASKKTLFIGTSVPALAMDRLHDKVKSELDSLKTPTDKRSRSRFEIVYLSDGVPKPRVDHLVAAAKLLWESKDETKQCVQKCSGEYKNYLLNKLYPLKQECTTNGNGCIGKLNAFQLAEGIGENEIPSGSFGTLTSQRWGSATDNIISNIVRKMNGTKDLFFKDNPSVQFRQSFLRIDASANTLKTTRSDLDPGINWIERSKMVYSSKYRYEVWDKNSGEPFLLFPSLSFAESYRVKQITALNLTARVNSNGQVEADSDGDGLLDSEEIKIGTNPEIARTNGYCLDSIFYRMKGCITVACDPELDEDGDGLNECEERTLGTSPIDFDTDNDGIPDGLEVLYGFNPLQNDAIVDSNYDGKMNIYNFQKGISPLLNPTSIKSDYLGNISVHEAQTKQIINDMGNSVQVPGYQIQILSLPLAQTRPKTTPEKLYRALPKTVENEWPRTLTGPTHANKSSVIALFGKVENSQNPKDFHWIIRYVEIPFGQPITISFDLDLMDYYMVPDPQWGDL